MPTEQPFPECVPELTDGVVTLRAHREDDAPRIVEQCTDPESMRWLPLPRPYGLEQADDYLGGVRAGWEDPDGRREWAISDADGRYLGSIGVFDRSAVACELGFMLHPDARGHGVMVRAVRLARAWALEHGVEVVRWRAAVGNWASRRVAWGCGFGLPTHVAASGHDHDGTPRDAWHAVWRRGDPDGPVIPWLVPPMLADARVVLREFAAADGDALPDAQDPVTARFMAPMVPTRSTYAAWLEDRRELAASGRGMQWAIVRRDTGEPAGGIAMIVPLPEPSAARVALVGYWLLAPHRGLGLAGAALDLVIEHALGPVAAGGLGLDGVRARADVENLPSIRTLFGSGLRHSGVERAAYPQPDRPANDAWVFDVLATDDRATQRIRPWPVPVIETARLRLRPWRDSDRPGPDDGPDDAARRFLPVHAQPSAQTFDAWLLRRRQCAAGGQTVDWCVADRQTDRMLGYVTLFTRGDAPIGFDAELGYWLVPTARGHGYLAEALPHVREHAFRPRADGGLEVTRLHAGADLDNVASTGVLARLGMREWGRDRQAWERQDGSLADGSYWELLRTDAR